MERKYFPTINAVLGKKNVWNNYSDVILPLSYVS